MTRWFSPLRAAKLAAGIAALFVVTWLVGAGVSDWQLHRGDGDELNDFRISSFDATYVVSRAEDGTADLDVTEEIVVDFGPYSDNHGIIRALPTRYRGRETPVEILGVADETGRTVRSREEDDGDVVSVRIGSPSSTVDDTETYVIRYRYSHVVQDFGDHQELYWDVNGINWAQTMDRVSVTVAFPDSAGSLTGDTACYAGDPGSTTGCSVSRAGGSTSASGTFTSSVGPLSPHQTLTVAVGLRPGTFALGPVDPGHRTAIRFLLGVGGAAVVLAALGVAIAATRRRRALRGRTVVPTFEPPAGLSPALAASLLGVPGRGVVAELLRAAVGGHVALRRVPETSELTARLLSWPADLEPESRDALELVFRGGRAGAVDGRDEIVRQRLALASDNDVAPVVDAAARAGLVSRPDARATGGWMLVLGVLAAVVLPWVARAHDLDVVLVWSVSGLVALALATGYGLALERTTWTERGRDALTTLEGLRMHLAVTDTRRLAVVAGATTTPTEDSSATLHVTEELLPYAVVLGVEDSWQRAMGTTWSTAPPSWLPDGGIDGLLRDLGQDGDVQSAVHDVDRRRGVTHRDGVSSLLSSAGSSMGRGLSDAFTSSVSSDGGGGSSWRSSRSGGGSRGGSRGGGHAGGGGGGGGGRGW